jgi:RNA ligase (TIGR02306 family)
MTYKVSVEEVKVYPHPNPKTDKLELVKIGDQQYVVAKGLYVTGDLAVAIPKNSIVDHPVYTREWGEYLQGPDKNKVGFKIMMGQESQGIIVKEDLFKEIVGHDIKHFIIGADISNLLHVKQYVAPIPVELQDTVEAYTGTLKREIKHDCKYPVVYLDKFAEGELVTITSKLHGSQVNIIYNQETLISTKGLWDKGLVFKQGVKNVYTEAWFNFKGWSNIWDILIPKFEFNPYRDQIQLVGEVVPIFSGFSYGHTEPTLYMFALYLNGVSVDLINFRHIHGINIVPELYRGAFHPITTMEISNGFAQQKVCPLDGVTPNEGVVVSNGRHYMKDKNLKFMGKHGNEEGT